MIKDDKTIKERVISWIKMDEGELVTDSSVIEKIRKGHRLRCQLSEITNGLKLYEKVSAIFLLSETPQTGLMIIEEILNDSNPFNQNNLFYKWLEPQLSFSGSDWQDVLAEVLTLIQNYKLAKILGYTKNYLLERFMPGNNLKSFRIPSVRKMLYNLCEQLSVCECNALVSAIEGTSADTVRYLEHVLLKWSEKGIIDIASEKEVDLQALIKGLKLVKLQKHVHEIEVVVEKTNCLYVRNKSVLKLQTESSEYYQIIDKNHLGLCVIINEKNFSHNLFPKRLGTDKDAERLTEVFTAFGFDIRLHVDLTFDQLVKTLAQYAAAIDKSSSFFVLIILSHGSENVIYTSDSHPVDMNTIEMIFQAELCPNLLGKPKIFIVQACQGERWQRVLQEEKTDVEADNCVVLPSKDVGVRGPQRGDSMIAWSTVQGFASFRDKYNGSWYIQELCSQLWKFGDTLDLVEILTKVNNNLRNKIYGGQFMVPSMLLSLRAKVQFPSVKENFAKGRKQMVERLIFDKLFKEFLISSKSPYVKLILKQ